MYASNAKSKKINDDFYARMDRSTSEFEVSEMLVGRQPEEGSWALHQLRTDPPEEAGFDT